MAKKKNGLLKFAVGVGAAAVAGKIRLRQLRISLLRKNRIVQSLKYVSIMQYVKKEMLK